MGREAETERLLNGVLGGLDGAEPRGRLVVVEGEAGVGKSRLAGELVMRASAAGARVLWGGCGPHPELPYEPVAEALAAAIAADTEAAADLSDVHADLFPLGLGLGTERRVDRSSRVDPDDRGGLFRAAAAAIQRLADRPLLWVVDDAQWAGPDTLALLDHVVRDLRDRPVTLLLACRHRGPDLAAMVGHLARTVPMTSFALSGLDAAAIERWLIEAEMADGFEVAEEIQRRTGGNPLFVAELVRAAKEARERVDPATVPGHLADLLDQRFDALPPDADLTLTASAVAGSSVTFGVLSEVTGLGDRELLAAVDALLLAGLLVERGDSLSFGHALVRDAVVARAGSARRSWFHLRTATALESWSDRPGIPAELARHYAAAGDGHGDDARRWALAAAVDALDRAAWSAAESWVGSVLGAGAAAPEDRVAALLVVARARRGIGDLDASRTAFDQALDLARLHRFPRRLAEVVRWMVGGGGIGAPDSARYRWVDVIEEALAGLGEDDEDLRIPLLGSLSLALLLTDRDGDRERAADEALTRARRHGDPALMAGALLDQRHNLGPDQASRRLADCGEAIALAERCHLPEVAVAALVYSAEDALVLGDRNRSVEFLDRASRHLERHPDAYWGWAVATWRVLHHVLDGDLGAAERASDDALGSVAGARDASWAIACYGVNVVLLRIHQGRAADVLDLLAAAAEDNPHIPCYRAVLAFVAYQTGDHARARGELGRLVDVGGVDVPHDGNRLLALAMLCEVVVGLGEASLAPALQLELEPVAGRYVTLNCFGGGGSVWGPVDAQRAALARLSGDAERADRWHACAVDQCRVQGDALFEARLLGILDQRR